MSAKKNGQITCPFFTTTKKLKTTFIDLTSNTSAVVSPKSQISALESSDNAPIEAVTASK